MFEIEFQLRFGRAPKQDNDDHPPVDTDAQTEHAWNQDNTPRTIGFTSTYPDYDD